MGTQYLLFVHGSPAYASELEVCNVKICAKKLHFTPTGIPLTKAAALRLDTSAAQAAVALAVAAGQTADATLTELPLESCRRIRSGGKYVRVWQGSWGSCAAGQEVGFMCLPYTQQSCV